MKVVIAGSSGFIGSALVSALEADNHEVTRLVRRAPSADNETQWDPSAGEIPNGVVDGVDAVVNLNGANIGAKRWTESYKKVLLTSRTEPTSLLAQTIADSNNPPKCFLSGSAIGFYGSRGDELLDESSSKGEGFLSDLTQKWEAAAQPATDAGVRTCFLRTGIVLDPSDSALKKMLPLFKLGLGGKMGNGKQYWSWITLQDEVESIIHLMNSELSGPVNLVAPNATTNADFTKHLGSALKRPTFFPVPKFGPSLLLGSELAQGLLFDSARVAPAALNSSGFGFNHADLATAFDEIL